MVRWMLCLMVVIQEVDRIVFLELFFDFIWWEEDFLWKINWCLIVIVMKEQRMMKLINVISVFILWILYKIMGNIDWMYLFLI